MNDCIHCTLEKDCHYPYKVCDCVHHRKFMTEEERIEWNKKNPTKTHY